MRCPKCGFTGFDHLDDCKKCGSDLTAFKARFNLRGPLFATAVPLTAPATVVTEPEIEEAPVAAAGASDFGYDFMDDEDSPAASAPAGFEEESEEEFSFEAVGGDLGPGTTEEEEEFTLETTSAAGAAALEEEEEVGVGDDEFLDLELDLSWDEKPTKAAGMSTAAAPAPFADEDAFELPSLDDLPPLEGHLPPEEEPLDDGFLEDLGELPDFSGFEEEPASVDLRKGSKTEGEPRDPFDLRGSVPAERTPVNSNQSGPEAAKFPGLPEASPACEPRNENIGTEAPPEIPPPPAGLTPNDPDGSTAEPLPFPPSSLSSLQPPLPPLTLNSPDLQGTEEVDPPPPLAARLGATLTDGLILAAGFALFVAAGEFAVAPPGEGRFLPSPASVADLLIPYFLVLFFLCFSYSTLFHFLLGQTVGKMLFRLRVAGDEDGPLLFSQAFLRSAGGVLSLLCAGAGYLPLLSGRRPWSDRLAGTRVLRLGPVAIQSLEIA